MVERLIMVKNCGECPLKETWMGELYCGKTKKCLGDSIEELKKRVIPQDCPLMPNQGGG